MKSPVLLAHDWYPAPLPAGVSIGEESWLYSAFAFLHCRSRKAIPVTIGRRCGIYNGCFFDLGPFGEVSIGDYSALVGVIVQTNGCVIIGNYCFLAHEVVIADTFAAVPLDDTFNETDDCVRLGDDVWVGAGAVLLKGARIGNGAVIGAGTVVDFEVQPYAIVAGNPARIVGYANRENSGPG